MSVLFSHFNYVIVIILMMIGLYIVFSSRNLIKKLAGLSVFQTSVFLLYITIGKVKGGQPPILVHDTHGSEHALNASGHALASAAEMAAGGTSHYASDVIYSNPLPHVLILTAIVVGVATLAIGLALVVRIREVYDTVEEDEINAIDYRYNLEGTAE